MSRSRRAVVGAILLAAPIVAGGFAWQNRQARDGAMLFGQVLKKVSDSFVDTVDAAALYEKAARGLVSQLNDPYTVLYTPKEFAAFTQGTNGRYAGVGMQIEDIKGLITVVKVFPNTPAAGAGIAEGDRIMMIDSASTRGWIVDSVSSKLKGEPGTRVRVRFNRPGVGDPITATFTRAVIHIPAVPFVTMLDGGIGYIPVQGFNETSASETVRGIQTLQQQGMKSLILDLRGNPGGILDEAFEMSNLFLPRGKEILTYRGRGDMNQQFIAENDPMLPNMPLVVLVDDGSASASEIVAGALQDHDRALIVGTTSYGKGLVQSLFRLDGGYALKMTTAKWFTPSGRSIQRPRRIVNGRFVEEEAPDSMETDSARKARPAFKSDAGRVIYGGGGITPDITVRPDTLTTIEQKAARQLGPKVQEAYSTMSQFAEELRPQVKSPDFVVPAAWRQEYFRRLVAAKVPVDSTTFFAGSTYFDRFIATRVARAVYGDSTVAKRQFGEDPQIQKAIEVLKKGRSQRDLFGMSSAPIPTAPATAKSTAARRP